MVETQLDHAGEEPAIQAWLLKNKRNPSISCAKISDERESSETRDKEREPREGPRSWNTQWRWGRVKSTSMP